MGSAVPDRETNDFLLRDVTKPLERGDEGDASVPTLPLIHPRPYGKLALLACSGKTFLCETTPPGTR